MSEADHSQGMKKAAKDKRLPWYPAVCGMGEHWSIPEALSTEAMHSAWELRVYFCGIPWWHSETVPVIYRRSMKYLLWNGKLMTLLWPVVDSCYQYEILYWEF